MACIMRAQPARFIVNQAAYLREDCFNPNGPGVQQLEAEGLIYEDLGGDDDDSDENE